ncbi:MAG: hypothetical protein H7256_00270 [Bdellovibrio sp.]|nr:hypothetical protein [Bdellovibrio sp.]
MKKTLVVSVLISLFSTIASAQVGSTYAQICNSWSYNSNAGGYVCSGYPMSQQFVDVFSLNSKISNLEYRLQKLEAKLAEISQ